MPIQSWILLAVAFVNFGLVATLAIRSRRNIADKLFILSILFNVFWSVGDAVFIGANNQQLAEIGSQVFFIAPMFTALFLLLFSRKYYDNKPMHLYKLLLLAIPPLVFSFFIGLNPDLLIKEIEIGSDVNIFIVNQIPFLLYSLYFMFYFGLSYIILYRKAQTRKAIERNQLFAIFYAAITSSFFALVSNLFLPFVGNSNYIWLGPIFTLLYIAIVSYAIVKHHLFDLRATIARVAAYILSVSGLVIVYMLIIYVVTGSNLVASDLSAFQRFVFVSLAVISAVAFQPFKHFFDRATNKLFYRDAYDPQVFISDLNQALVTNTDIESLLTKSALIIQENLKTSFATFYIRETSYFPARIIGAHRKQPEIDNFSAVETFAPKLHRKVISAEERSESSDHESLLTTLKENDIEVMARMVNTLDYEVKGIGYIFIGPKRSGSPYSAQDLKIIEIIANELVIAIENVLRFEEIEQFNVTLQKKIDEATKELKQSNDKLRALDEAKDEFVSMASHQLRTPLTSIKGYLSMVLEGDAGKITSTQKDMLGQAFFSSQRMVYLISDLLNVSRLKTGKFIIESKPVYLPDVIEDETNQLQEGARTKNLTLSFTKPKTFPTMKLDEMKIRQVVMNFTDNAIYYTPSGGKITVSLKESAKSVEFTVKDSGIGVPKEQQPKLFTKFYRADNARKARPDGTGLGLFMAKKVIIAQGGSIIFDSKEGKGSTFGFSFPREKLEVITEKSTGKK